MVLNSELRNYINKIPENLGTQPKIVAQLKRRFGCTNHRIAQARGLKGIRLLETFE